MNIGNWLKRHEYKVCGGLVGGAIGIFLGSYLYGLTIRIDDVDSDLKSALSTQKKELVDALLNHQQEEAKKHDKHEAEIGQMKSRLNSAEDRLTAIEDTLQECPCNERTPAPVPAPRAPQARRVNNTARDTVVVRDTVLAPVDLLPTFIEDDTPEKPDTVAASRDTVLVTVNNKKKKFVQNGNGIVINGNNNNITINNNFGASQVAPDTARTVTRSVQATATAKVIINTYVTRQSYCR